MKNSDVEFSEYIGWKAARLLKLSTKTKVLLGLVIVIAGYAMFLKTKNTQLEDNRAREGQRLAALRFLALTPEQWGYESSYNSRGAAAAKFERSIRTLSELEYLPPSEYYSLKEARPRDSDAVCMDYRVTDGAKDSLKGLTVLTPNWEVYSSATDKEDIVHDAWRLWCGSSLEQGY